MNDKLRPVPLPTPATPFTAGETAPEAAQATIGQDRKILIVDDNAVAAKAFELKLKACGFTVVTVTEPSVGISAARRERPDALILDLNFDSDGSFTSLNWNGKLLLEWLKHFKDLADIPIIILTVDEPNRSKDAVIAAGASAFFQKPVDMKVFMAELTRLVGNKPRN